MPARIPGLQAKFASPDGILPASLGLNPFALSHQSEGEAPGLVIFFTRASAACSRNCIFPRVPGPRPCPDNLKYLFSQRNMRLER